MKRSTRVDAAQSTPSSPAAGLAQSAADKIVPLAQNAAAKAVPLAQSAAERMAPLPGQAVAFASPYAQQAVEAVAPYAQQAADRVSPYAHTVADTVSPYAQTVADKLSPYAHTVAEKVGPLAASGAVAAHEAADKIGPAVEAARDRVSDELLPRLSTALTAAAASPLAVEATRRGKATYAAARGELSLPEVEEKSGSGWWKRIAVVAAVAGVVALVARRFLGASKDSGWQAARPSAPYSPPAPPADVAPVDDLTPVDDLSATTAENLGLVDELPPASEGVDVVEEVTLAEDPAITEVSDTGDSPVAEVESPYGPGSYVGAEPPAGFEIKGNENSMKYHLPGGRGYSQTHAEVWFDSEEAAERSGFVRAQS